MGSKDQPWRTDTGRPQATSSTNSKATLRDQWQSVPKNEEENAGWKKTGFFQFSLPSIGSQPEWFPFHTPWGVGGRDKCLETFPSVTEWEGDSGAPGV